MQQFCAKILYGDLPPHLSFREKCLSEHEDKCRLRLLFVLVLLNVDEIGAGAGLYTDN